MSSKLNTSPDFVGLCSAALEAALTKSSKELAQLNDIERMELIIDAYEERKPGAQVISLILFLLHAGDNAALHTLNRDAYNDAIN